MAASSLTYVRGFRKGYAVAARSAGKSPAYQLLDWLVNLMLIWTMAVLLLWFAAEILTRNLAGDQASKVTLDRHKAWNVVNDRGQK